MKNRFYMLCLRETVGGNASFWCRNGHGYNTNIDQAHVYTLEEAQSRWNTAREIDQPISADSVDALAVYHVDHQHIPGETTLVDGCTQYVAFEKGRWDGNDLYWLSNGSLPTTNFANASVFNEPGELEGLVWLPFSLVDSKKRRTFAIRQMDARKMVQGAGLRIPDHIRKARRRKGSTKTRWNCPVCGRFVYQDNPYDFEGCNNSLCEGACHG
ncbi:hypothetical protein [Enterobacter soli]|uniref:hypothetical protein n=1 Tax=Enterobacter soli TaxID=885040 RepID=UPI002F3F3942